MRLYPLALCVVLLLLLPGRAALAQLHFAGDAPRVYTVEPREHLYTHEISLGAGALPLDAFYVGAAPHLGYTYHASELWGWEAVHGFYSFNFDTPLREELRRAAADVDNKNQKIRFIMASSLIYKPIYGKIAAFNASRVQADTRLLAGLGVANTDKNTGAAIHLGASLHFWAGRAVAIRFDVRDYLVFTSLSPDNMLMLSLAVSFNFSVQTMEPKPAPG